jgi:hypothetical protein
VLIFAGFWTVAQSGGRWLNQSDLFLQLGLIPVSHAFQLSLLDRWL